METVEYMNRTRPASMSLTNMRGKDHHGQYNHRRSQQRAGKHRSRMRQNQDAVLNNNRREEELNPSNSLRIERTGIQGSSNVVNNMNQSNGQSTTSSLAPGTYKCGHQQ